MSVVRWTWGIASCAKSSATSATSISRPYSVARPGSPFARKSDLDLRPASERATGPASDARRFPSLGSVSRRGGLTRRRGGPSQADGVGSPCTPPRGRSTRCVVGRIERRYPSLEARGLDGNQQNVWVGNGEEVSRNHDVTYPSPRSAGNMLGLAEPVTRTSTATRVLHEDAALQQFTDVAQGRIRRALRQLRVLRG